MQLRSWGITNGSNGNSCRRQQQMQQQPHRLAPSPLQTTGGRRALTLVVSLSLCLYLMLVGPHNALRWRQSISPLQIDRQAAYEALGVPLPQQPRLREAVEQPFGREACLAADVLLPAVHQQHDATAPAAQGGEEEEGLQPQRPVPLLATNLDFDTEAYLTRLVDGGWYAGPSESRIARHKLVVAGGCDPFVL